MRTTVVANIKKTVADNGELVSGNAFDATASNSIKQQVHIAPFATKRYHPASFGQFRADQ